MQRHYTTHEQEVQYIEILLLVKHVWTKLRMS
jgi:hypothetical protein